MSRIGDIRAILVGLGGNSNFKYYADGTTYGALYKIEKYTDGLTHAQRLQAVVMIDKLPEVDSAYLSRVVPCPYSYMNPYSYINNVVSPEGYGRHIKIRYASKAK